MTDTELATLSKADLIQLIRQHEATLARLQGRITELETQLEEARRTAKRQAAPFSTGSPQAHPRQPGRKAGHAPAHRPPPDHVDHTEEAALPKTCPECGGTVTEEQVEVQYQVDIPPMQGW